MKRQREFPFMGKGEDDASLPPPHTDADAPPEDEDARPPESPRAVARRMARRGVSREAILAQVREIRGLLEGQGRSTVPGTAPLVDAFERAGVEARDAAAQRDTSDWSASLDELEDGDDERGRFGAGMDDERPPAH